MGIFGDKPTLTEFEYTMRGLALSVSSPLCQMYLVRNFFQACAAQLSVNPYQSVEVRSYILSCGLDFGCKSDAVLRRGRVESRRIMRSYRVRLAVLSSEEPGTQNYLKLDELGLGSLKFAVFIDSVKEELDSVGYEGWDLFFTMLSSYEGSLNELVGVVRSLATRGEVLAL